MRALRRKADLPEVERIWLQPLTNGLGGDHVCVAHADDEHQPGRRVRHVLRGGQDEKACQGSCKQLTDGLGGDHVCMAHADDERQPGGQVGDDILGDGQEHRGLVASDEGLQPRKLQHRTERRHEEVYRGWYGRWTGARHVGWRMRLVLHLCRAS